MNLIEFFHTDVPDVSCSFQEAPALTNLIWKSGGNSVLLGENVTYECKPGMKFETDPDRTELTATCLDGNILDPVGGWFNCISSKRLLLFNIRPKILRSL